MTDGQVQVEQLGEGGTVEAVLDFSEKAVCHQCGAGFAPLTPASFSFNSPQGACPACNGLGTTTAFDPRRIVPDPELSLREGAVAPWAHRSSVHFAEFLEALTGAYGVDVHTPYRLLPEAFKKVLLYGSGDREIPFSFEGKGRVYRHTRPFEGVIPNLQRRYLETPSPQSREEIEAYLTFLPCAACGGARLNEASRSVRFQNLSIAEVTAMTVDRAAAFFDGLALGGRQADISRPILSEVAARLGFLRRVGLGYLAVERSATTLSGGESQRIRLATQIGSRLTGVLYVLDEPSIGLHPRDHRRLLDALCRMRDIGNTVLVVEHDADTILRADHVVDMGPGAGAAGGQVVFSGPP
jgi:excinuclease ABC subunit A